MRSANLSPRKVTVYHGVEARIGTPIIDGLKRKRRAIDYLKVNNIRGRVLREKKKAFLNSLVYLKRRVSITPEPD